MTILSALEQLAGLVLFVPAVQAWAAMNHRTRHCFRFVYGLIGLAGLALALDPIFGAELTPAARAVLVLAFALHMILDRRRIRPQRDPVPPAIAAAQDPDKTLQPGQGVAGV